MAKHLRSKEAWLRRLQQTSLPSFNQNVQILSDTDQFVGSHTSELAKVILKDPGLTASVLKLANSVQFNRHGNAIRTVSRSVMLIGHHTIKEICTSCMLLEELLKTGASKALKSILARSVHAAIQAKEIMNMKDAQSAEEVFISALLINIGEISVYSSLAESDPLMAKLSQAYPFERGKEKDLIGCYFNDLTLSLCHSWGIAPMISETLAGHYSETSVCRSILLANSFSVSCENVGYEAAVKGHIKTISRFCGKTPDEITECLKEATETTQKHLAHFGLKLQGINEGINAAAKAKPFEVVINKSNQLDAIQELSSLAEERLDLNLALQLLLEGLSRGAGFRSCLIGLLNPERTRLVAKQSIEMGNANVKRNFEFNCALQLPEIEQGVLTHRNIMLSETLRARGKTLREITRQLGINQSIWGPLIVKNTVIGCIYADNGCDQQSEGKVSQCANKITAEQVNAFALFVYQAKLNLSSQPLF